jgi:hypothetical protein
MCGSFGRSVEEPSFGYTPCLALAPATGPEQVPELGEREIQIRRHQASWPRAAQQGGARVAQPSAEAAGTPEDLNDSIWDYWGDKGHQARHGLGCTARAGLHVSLDVYEHLGPRQRRTVPRAPASRDGQPLAYRALLFGTERRRRPNAPSLFPIDAT